ncbi:MAG TPA: (2Fe-2S)-binding protein, partial [Actinomycetota bacterium]|nr:(2Fe-2S)-binding protein [Actinomycetota bacterium]
MITQRLMRKVEEAGFLDAVAGPVEGIANKALQNDGVRDSLTGRWLGHPVHPAISDAPVGFFTAATILDFMPGNETAVKRLIAAGLAVTAPTAASGVAEWVYTIGGQKRIGLAHAGFNTLG